MNQYFLESILLNLFYRTLWGIIGERATSINIFFIFGYVRNLTQKGAWWMGSSIRWVGGRHIIHKKYKEELEGALGSAAIVGKNNNEMAMIWNHIMFLLELFIQCIFIKFVFIGDSHFHYSLQWHPYRPSFWPYYAHILWHQA